MNTPEIVTLLADLDKLPDYRCRAILYLIAHQHIPEVRDAMERINEVLGEPWPRAQEEVTP